MRSGYTAHHSAEIFKRISKRQRSEAEERKTEEARKRRKAKRLEKSRRDNDKGEYVGGGKAINIIKDPEDKKWAKCRWCGKNYNVSVHCKAREAREEVSRGAAAPAAASSNSGGSSESS